MNDQPVDGPTAKRTAIHASEDAGLPNDDINNASSVVINGNADGPAHKRPKVSSSPEVNNGELAVHSSSNDTVPQSYANGATSDPAITNIQKPSLTPDPEGFVASEGVMGGTPNETKESDRIPDPPLASTQTVEKQPPANKRVVEKQERSTRVSPRADSSSNPTLTTRSSRKSSRNNASESEIISSLIDLPALSRSATLEVLSDKEMTELEMALEIADEGGWREDWSGNLAYMDKEVPNPKKTRNGIGAAGTFRQPLYIWAQKNNPVALRILHNLFRYVYHLDDTPKMAKTILANADPKDAVAMEQAFRRVSYDPNVLRQDGWTTAKSSEPMGATGGAFRIGDHVRWQGSDGVVIAYIHDHDLGDLWRGIWLDEALESFDMEAEELHDARKKWERRSKSAPGSSSSQGKQQKKQDQSRRSHRYSATSDFQVDGVEYGIVLAASFSRGARPGVYWPARVMHASEAANNQSGKTKRGGLRQRLDLVFLAPYWNSNSNAGTTVPVASNRRVVESFAESLSRHGESLFNTGPLFDLESVDVSEEMIQEYPYDGKEGGINLDQLRVAFRFTGLPKAAFPRFLDSHRLALALRTYAQNNLQPRSSDQASAGLFETHPMSVVAPMFPPEVLHLPYPFILSQLPLPPTEQALNDGEERHLEPILQINTIIAAMKPPTCWGQARLGMDAPMESPSRGSSIRVAESPYIDTGALLRQSKQSNGQSIDLDQFTKDLVTLREAVQGNRNAALEAMLQSLQQLVSLAPSGQDNLSMNDRRMKSRSLTKSWVFTKTHGEDAISTTASENNIAVLSEWRRACERVYKYITHAMSTEGFGNGVSVVLTDFRCNHHITSCGCFERVVRLPAALRAAKDVGAGVNKRIPLLTTVEEYYVDTAENKVLMKAHSAGYLRRMKARCAQIQGDNVAYLTEDSDGNGGEDTKGSRGTWSAAVACVGAAIKAVDMVVEGECVNVFCATRPPGHHAGRDLHPMKAVSNGFCILNAAACAALHATTSISEGGQGLRRVCVIDFDVHHGNGTQDILCSTYDPRFLYVSLHAGGAHVNGMPSSEEFDSAIHSPGASSQKKGIYPGRCGDTSPHSGVLNIPLGPKVTSHAVGTALINQVTPTVDSFSPDLIILSTGFDAHKNDPLGLGGLSAEDFGHITDVACQMAFKCCSGRLISIMEGGYGVPCCRPQTDLFLPKGTQSVSNGKQEPSGEEKATSAQASSYEKPKPSEEELKETSGVEGDQVTTQKRIEESLGSSQPGDVNQNTQMLDVNGTEEQPEVGVVDKKDPTSAPETVRPQPSKLLDLGEDLPLDMDDQVPYALQRRLEKCHAEGFMDCVRGHVKSLTKCSTRR